MNFARSMHGPTAGQRDWLWLAPWAALLIAPLLLRGAMPPDEIRYLSVAWEMWSSGDLLVPHLNGVPYSDKPPLLFWLMHLGWLVTGVNEWWPRLLPGLFALTAILLTKSLCRALWPERPEVARTVPWLLLGTFAWSVYTQIVLFDLLLVNWTLLGMLGFVRAGQGDKRGWILVAVVTGLGILTKGPATFVHLGGPGLLGPWWARSAREAKGRWYASLGLAFLAGGLLALAWAVPAALLGGREYASEILLGQTTGRMTQSFAHARPFWFYVWMLPVLLLPWSLWPGAWSAARRAWSWGKRDAGARPLLAAIVPTFIVFSAISGKQPHYLLPLVPLISAVIAWSFASTSDATARVSAWLPVIVAAVATLGFGFLPLLTGTDLAVSAWSPAWSVGAAALMLPLALRGDWQTVATRLALAVPVAVLASEAAFFLANAPAYDVSEAGARVRAIRDDGHPIAWIGDYNGELGFQGRLTQPVDIVDEYPEDVLGWASLHPDGYIVSKRDAAPEPAVFVQRQRGKWLAITQARDASAVASLF